MPLTGFADTNLDCTDGTLGGNVAHNTGAMPCSEDSADDTTTRATPLRQDVHTDQAGSDLGSADPPTFAATSVDAEWVVARATGLHGAALFVGGGMWL